MAASLTLLPEMLRGKEGRRLPLHISDHPSVRQQDVSRVDASQALWAAAHVCVLVVCACVLKPSSSLGTVQVATCWDMAQYHTVTHPSKLLAHLREHRLGISFIAAMSAYNPSMFPS